MKAPSEPSSPKSIVHGFHLPRSVPPQKRVTSAFLPRYVSVPPPVVPVVMSRPSVTFLSRLSLALPVIHRCVCGCPRLLFSRLQYDLTSRPSPLTPLVQFVGTTFQFAPILPVLAGRTVLRKLLGSFLSLRQVMLDVFGPIYATSLC